MKALKGKTLMSLIYASCLAIPLVSIGVRSAYTIVNKNAYQSYSGETQQTISQSFDVDELQYNNEYSLVFTKDQLFDGNKYIYADFIEMESFSGITTSLSGYNTIYMYGNRQFAFDGDGLNTIYGNTSNVLSIKFIYISQSNSTITGLEGCFKTTSVVQSSFLDNVFDYSVSKLVDENNFGQLNFFSWFDNMLLTDAQQNMLYVRFVNWYLNYAMLVSLMQILFLCLMWFVNFSRRLLERGMNYDW